MMRRYPDEIKEFIKNHVVGRTTRELTAMLNDRFNDSGFHFTESKVKAYKSNHKLKSGTLPGVRKGTTTKFPREMMEYVKRNAKGIGNQEMADRCNKLFGISITAQQMRDFKRNHGISSGLTGRFEKGHVPATKGKKIPSHPNSQKTQFKKGHIPHNHAEVGTLSHTTDGYLVRKIGEPDQWELEARLIYEREKGKIPEGKIITYLDGNKDNVSIENLALITCDVNLELNRRKYRFQNPELTQSGILAAQLAVDMRKRKGDNIMELSPRKRIDKGGILCLPLDKNLNGDTQAKHPDWTPIKCPKCGQKCWKMPIADTLKRTQGVSFLCTECAIAADLLAPYPKKQGRPGENRAQRRRKK